MNNWHPSYFFNVSESFHPSLFKGIETVWGLLDRLQDYLESLNLGKKSSPIPAGVYLENPESITICEHVTLEPGAFIRGPCYIGAGSVIRHGAYIRGGLLTGENCVIGHATEIKNALLLEGAQAAHFAYVGDSILGSRCNLGAGTRLANLRLDQQKITIRSQGKLIETGRRKFGAIVGDDVQLGCNVVANPGTLIGPRALVSPLLNIGGFIEADSILKRETCSRKAAS